MDETDKQAKVSRFKPKTRRGKWIASIVAFLGTMGLGAMAAILISAMIGGSVQVVDKPVAQWSTTTGIPTQQVSTDGSGIACTPTLASGKLNVAITGAMPGASCVIQSGAYASGGNLRLQDITLGSAAEVELLSQSVGSKDSLICGDTLPAGASASYAAPVVMRVTIPQDATTGTKPVNGSLTAVPAAQYEAALCTAS